MALPMVFEVVSWPAMNSSITLAITSFSSKVSPSSSTLINAETRSVPGWRRRCSITPSK